MSGLDERVADSHGQELTVGASELCRRGALGCSGLLFLQNSFLPPFDFKSF